MGNVEGRGEGVWIIRRGDRGMIARAATDERRNSKRPSVTKTFGRLCVYGMTSVKSLRKADNRVRDRLSFAAFAAYNRIISSPSPSFRRKTRRMCSMRELKSRHRKKERKREASRQLLFRRNERKETRVAFGSSRSYAVI